MAQVDIYLTKGSSQGELSNFACILCEKILSSGKHATIVCSDEYQASSLSEALWAFKQASFLPNMHSQKPSKDAPIAVTESQQFKQFISTQKQASPDAVIYMSPLVAEPPKHFGRSFIVVANENQTLNAARTLYKTVKLKGIEVQSHDLRSRA